ncbi:MAG: carbon-nitrogen family hydrolase [Phycisphaeraceae bacterium]|nr:hypothetical protein [Phycisphaerales bacterium]MCB9859082.1 carbon-nitrogen family hydrolase [Phycisphaeraceae bacterium]
MRAHLVQFDILWQNKHANFDRVANLLSDARPEAGDFVLLPEMFDTGFSFAVSATADENGETIDFVRSIALKYDITIQAGRTVRSEDVSRARNEAPIVTRDGVVATYTKIHPFSHGFPGQREVDTFDSGAEVITYAWRCDGVSMRVCPAICYDLRFAELFRRGLDMGAEVFALGANWPVARQEHWRALLIARAIENQAFVFGVNRIGRDPSLEYVGGTIAVGPRGEVLGELKDEEAVLTVEIDPRDVTRWREKFHAWEDRRLGLDVPKRSAIVPAAPSDPL